MTLSSRDDSVIPGRAQREPGIHSHNKEFGEDPWLSARPTFLSGSMGPRLASRPGTTPIGRRQRTLRLRVARVQHDLAGGRHLRQRHRRFRLGRFRRRLRVQHTVAEPIGEIGRLAALVLGLRRLALALA